MVGAPNAGPELPGGASGGFPLSEAPHDGQNVPPTTTGVPQYGQKRPLTVRGPDSCRFNPSVGVPRASFPSGHLGTPALPLL